MEFRTFSGRISVQVPSFSASRLALLSDIFMLPHMRYGDRHV